MARSPRSHRPHLRPQRTAPGKTNPGVRDGVVQKKNRTEPSPGWKNWHQRVPVIERLRPGPGYRHVLRKADVVRFVGLLPDWSELARGLDGVLLAPGEDLTEGTYGGDVITLHAWTRELGQRVPRDFVEDHEELLARLNVPVEPLDEERALLHWTEPTVRAYQLMHVFLHELGHHHDRMTTRSRRESSRGEEFAEDFALRLAEPLWPAYVATFGDF